MLIQQLFANQNNNNQRQNQINQINEQRNQINQQRNQINQQRNRFYQVYVPSDPPAVTQGSHLS